MTISTVLPLHDRTLLREDMKVCWQAFFLLPLCSDITLPLHRQCSGSLSHDHLGSRNLTSVCRAGTQGYRKDAPGENAASLGIHHLRRSFS
jgi:hypothetical protein